MDNNQKIQIENVPIDTLIHAEYNPRKWSDDVLEKVEKSIRNFGIVDPLIVNSAGERENIVIGGNLRLEVAKRMGFTELPVVRVHIADIEREKELCLRLNRNVAEWDYEKLGQNFDIKLLLDIGFDEADFSNIYNDVLEVENDEFDEEKELAKIVNPKAQPGEMYGLGKHRILCGNSTLEENVKTLMGDEKVAMIYCDPIYNIRLNYDKGVSGKRAYGGKQTKDNKSDAEYKEFLRKTIKNALSVAENDCHVFNWCDQRYIWLLQELYTELGIDFKRVCLWIKNAANPTPQVAFNKVYEPCVYGTRGTPFLTKNLKSFNEVFNKEVNNGNRLGDDILDLLDIWLVRRLPTSGYTHSTSKPPNLHEKPLRRCTKPGDIVLDLFGGSGSTLIACEQLKRKAFLCEIEPIFIDLIIQRYEKLTGIKAKKLN